VESSREGTVTLLATSIIQVQSEKLGNDFQDLNPACQYLARMTTAAMAISLKNVSCSEQILNTYHD
jgi:hypothetical protein